ncbi:MAG: AAC(3) family N-acetyltransferase [Candidatus Promineifilaceae bacterium]
MSEAEIVQKTETPLTRRSLAEVLDACGLSAGQIVLVHSSMSKLGWIPGGPEAVVLALLDVLGEDGTLMMPSHTSDNSDPARWENPPVPEAWWPLIRESTPPYNPATTPSRMMGAIPELFRTWPGTIRSDHPVSSFAAKGPMAEYLISDHSLEEDLGDMSPVGKLYELDGYVLLLGVGHSNNTSLHLAEYRCDYPSKHSFQTGSSMLVDGEQRWVTYETLDLQDDDFEQLGASFDSTNNITIHRIAQADVRLYRQRSLVDYAVDWMENNRK